eukprot:bmy_20486T0
MQGVRFSAPAHPLSCLLSGTALNPGKCECGGKQTSVEISCLYTMSSCQNLVASVTNDPYLGPVVSHPCQSPQCPLELEDFLMPKNKRMCLILMLPLPRTSACPRPGAVIAGSRCWDKSVSIVSELQSSSASLLLPRMPSVRGLSRVTYANQRDTEGPRGPKEGSPGRGTEGSHPLRHQVERHLLPRTPPFLEMQVEEGLEGECWSGLV